jgi:hypothetical protein
MKEVMQALYWYLHTAYLKNDREKAKRFADLLDAEQESSDASLMDAIGEKHYSRYILLRDNMSRDQYCRLSAPGYSTPAFEMARQKEKSVKEKDFCRGLLRRKEEIMSLLDLSPKSSMVPELDMRPYGRCDFSVLDRESRVAVAIEVKIGEAPASTVSQIDKYMLCLELDMIKGLHDEVWGCVIADSFPYYVSSEFSRMGVHMVLGGSKLSIFGKQHV